MRKRELTNDQAPRCTTVKSKPTIHPTGPKNSISGIPMRKRSIAFTAATQRRTASRLQSHLGRKIPMTAANTNGKKYDPKSQVPNSIEMTGEIWIAIANIIRDPPNQSS